MDKVSAQQREAVDFSECLGMMRMLFADPVLQLNGIEVAALLFLGTCCASCLARSLVCLICNVEFGVSSIEVQIQF